MHKKQLGNLGEMKIAADLISQGYEVFTELGDNSKVDLIALDKDCKPIKIQVKCLTTKKNAVELSRRKSGPNYSFKYQDRHADVYAVYLHKEDIICYVPAHLLMMRQRSLTIRTVKPVNNQFANVNMAEQFKDFKKALRGYTCDTLTVDAEGDERVQTSKP